MLELLTVLAALAAAPAAATDWRELDARETPMGRVAVAWDQASVERRGDRVRVRLREPVLLSGLPNSVYFWRVEIDCARRTARERRPAGAWRRRHPLTPRYERLAAAVCP